MSSDIEADGYSPDDKRTFVNGIGDIPDIVERFRNREKENPNTAGLPRDRKCFESKRR